MPKQAASVYSVDVIAAVPGQGAAERIRERLRAAIASGALAANARLPSARVLARDFAVARNTVDAALDQLAAEGYLVRRRGAGSFVAARLPERDAPPVRAPRARGARVSPPPALSARARALESYPGHYAPLASAAFTPSLPPLASFPRKIWNRLLNREARRAGSDYWEYGASNGLGALREAIAAHAAAMRATRAAAEQVIVVTSTQQALDVAARALADPGARAWVESPGYQPAQYVLRGAGLEVVPVPVDGEGLSVAAGRALEPHARLAYVTPAHQYPLGYEMSLARRRELFAWACEADAYVLEDDYDGDYRYEGRPIASLQGMDEAGRVIYVGSFNKILFPGLRVAYVIVPEPLIGAFVNTKHVADGHTALLTQGVLAAFIREGHLARHVRRTRALYDENRRAFLEEARVLEEYLEFGPARAGMHVTAYLRAPWSERVTDAHIAAVCARSGIEVHPLSKYGAPARAGLVFGFAGTPRSAARVGLAVVRRALRTGAD
jgi:GntR family transcriptional regulator/MocR family aminotransferase